MVLMFEEAYKQQPMNEELGAQTFFANVRAGQWKSAQQVLDFIYRSCRSCISLDTSGCAKYAHALFPWFPALSSR